MGIMIFAVGKQQHCSCRVAVLFMNVNSTCDFSLSHSIIVILSYKYDINIVNEVNA